MIIYYLFDLNGLLLKTDSSEEIVEVGQNLFRPVPEIKKGVFIELEINDKLWMGIVNDIDYFPKNTNGNRAVHIFIHDLHPKYQTMEEDE